MYSYELRIRDRQLLDVGIETIEDVLKTREQIIASSTEVWRSTEKLLALFGMDPLRDIHKVSSTQMMVKDVDNKRNLSQKDIEAIIEIDAEVTETRLIQPYRIITPTKYFVQRVEKSLRTKVIIPMCKGEADMEKKQLNRVDSILKDFKIWKAFIDQKSQPSRHS
jgi:predicted RecB family nuclease